MTLANLKIDILNLKKKLYSKQGGNMKEKKVSFFRWFFVEKDSANVIVYLVLLFSAALSFVVFAASSDEYENILPALFFFGLGLLVLEVICYFTDYWWEP